MPSRVILLSDNMEYAHGGKKNDFFFFFTIQLKNEEFLLRSASKVLHRLSSELLYSLPYGLPHDMLRWLYEMELMLYRTHEQWTHKRVSVIHFVLSFTHCISYSHWCVEQPAHKAEQRAYNRRSLLNLCNFEPMKCCYSIDDGHLYSNCQCKIETEC